MDPTGDLQSIFAAIGVTVVVPYEISLNGRSIIFSALIPHFGSQNGMVVDPDWSVIQPHAHSLNAAGFGYSCMSIQKFTAEGLRHVLKDWGWSGPTDRKPDWATQP